MTNTTAAELFTSAIKDLVSKPDNLESYLSNHFAEWINKHANTPEGIAAELKSFADMTI